MKHILKIISKLLLCSLGIIILGCNKENVGTNRVNFILEDGFSGVFLLRKSNDAKQSITSDIYNISIDESGIGEVPNFDMISSWHRLSAQYKNGESIPWGLENKNNKTSIWTLGFYSTAQEQYYFIGIRDDYNQIIEIKDRQKLPIGHVGE